MRRDPRLRARITSGMDTRAFARSSGIGAAAFLQTQLSRLAWSYITPSTFVPPSAWVDYGTYWTTQSPATTQTPPLPSYWTPPVLGRSWTVSFIYKPPYNKWQTYCETLLYTQGSRWYWGDVVSQPPNQPFAPNTPGLNIPQGALRAHPRDANRPVEKIEISPQRASRPRHHPRDAVMQITPNGQVQMGTSTPGQRPPRGRDGKRQRERKARFGNKITRAIFWGMNQVTEAVDFLEVLYKASGGRYSRAGPRAMWAYLFEYGGIANFDLEDFLWYFAVETAEDYFYGRVGRRVARFNAEQNRPIGIATGPAL